MADPLPEAEVARALAGLDGWRSDGRAITKTYTFPDFRAAVWFMIGAAHIADAMDHHPDWRNVYNRVDVTLSTHDAGGITDKDLALAEAMDGVAG